MRGSGPQFRGLPVVVPVLTFAQFGPCAGIGGGGYSPTAPSGSLILGPHPGPQWVEGRGFSPATGWEPASSRFQDPGSHQFLTNCFDNGSIGERVGCQPAAYFPVGSQQPPDPPSTTMSNIGSIWGGINFGWSSQHPFGCLGLATPQGGGGVSDPWTTIADYNCTIRGCEGLLFIF